MTLIHGVMSYKHLSKSTGEDGCFSAYTLWRKLRYFIVISASSTGKTSKGSTDLGGEHRFDSFICIPCSNFGKFLSK